MVDISGAMGIRVVIAPSGFKEGLGAEQVASAIAAGVRRADPWAEIIELPLADGGEGFTETLVCATNGELFTATVTGPTGKPVEATFGFLGGDGPRTGVVALAAAAGLRLVPRDERDPLATTTYGVGELICHALDGGAERLLIGCGDSGTNDGGAGMAQALGAKLLDKSGADIGRGGAALADLATIDLTGLDARLCDLSITVACNPHNILTGEHGVAEVYGPQKGADRATIDRLAAALDTYAAVIERDLGIDVRSIPGGGASGGTGAGLHALLGADLRPRFDVVMEYLHLDKALEGAHLVISAEGGIDKQTANGKIPSEVARRAEARGIPVVTLAGTVGDGAEHTYATGVDAFFGVLRAPTTLAEAISDSADLLDRSAENVVRLFLSGAARGRA